MKKVFLVLALLLFWGVSAYAQGINHNNDHDRVLVIIYPDHASAAVLSSIFGGTVVDGSYYGNRGNSGFNRGNNNNRYNNNNNRYNGNNRSNGNNNKYDRNNNRGNSGWDNNFKSKNFDNNNRGFDSGKAKSFDRW